MNETLFELTDFEETELYAPVVRLAAPEMFGAAYISGGMTMTRIPPTAGVVCARHAAMRS